MELYHIGEGIQGILNGCNDIIECQEKIEGLVGILDRLNDLKNQGQRDGIDEKIAEVRDTL